MAAKNTENLREIERVIASVVILSSDGKLLMGRKDPAGGGVYADVWHIPGGGIEPGESLEDAARREAQQEIVGLDLTGVTLNHLPFIGHGQTVKTLESGEKVWCKMEFNRFEIHLDKPAAGLAKILHPGDDLAELHWFAKSELATTPLIPGGKEFFAEAGYI